MPKYFAFLLCLAAAASVALYNPAMAEMSCQQASSKAMMLLGGFKQSALNNQHPDADKFQAEFQPLMQTMQENNCMSELMGLMQYVQKEQKLFPMAPAGMADPSTWTGDQESH